MKSWPAAIMMDVIKVRRCIAALLAVAADAPADDQTGTWRLDKEGDGIQIFTRPVQGSAIREIRGATGVAAPFAAVVAVLADVSAIPQLSEMVSEARVLDSEGGTRCRYYSAIGVPWPLRNRDVVYQRRITQDPATLAVVLTDVAVGDAPPRDGYVRMTQSRQQWTVTPNGRQVLVEMRALSDPNGPIPSGIINMMSVGAPYKTLEKLRKLVMDPRYANARLPFMKEPQ
jgi:hypothetical protein